MRASASTVDANDGVIADGTAGVTVADPAIRGIWVDPTDGSMENGLSISPSGTEPWPSTVGSFVNYIDLDDPAYGLDPTTDYRVTNIELCIRDRDNDWWDHPFELHVIILEWGGGVPSDESIYAQLGDDTTGWSQPGQEYYWVTIEITDPDVHLPREFAIGMHPYWTVPAPFYLGLDQNSPPHLGWLNYNYGGAGWVPVGYVGYPGTWGVRFEVEELDATGIELPGPLLDTSFSKIKSNYL